jgi:hypothetical protein
MGLQNEAVTLNETYAVAPRRKGAPGLLLALVRAGIDEDALEAAAALVAQLDEDAGLRRKGAAT